jgi:hypothetical protein
MSLSRTPSPPLPRKRGREQVDRVAPMCVNPTCPSVNGPPG